VGGRGARPVGWTRRGSRRRADPRRRERDAVGRSRPARAVGAGQDDGARRRRGARVATLRRSSARDPPRARSGARSRRPPSVSPACGSGWERGACPVWSSISNRRGVSRAACQERARGDGRDRAQPSRRPRRSRGGGDQGSAGEGGCPADEGDGAPGGGRATPEPRRLRAAHPAEDRPRPRARRAATRAPAATWSRRT
jgi:hypothetical protein